MNQNVIYVGIDVDDVRYHVSALDRRSGEVLDFQESTDLERLGAATRESPSVGFNQLIQELLIYLLTQIRLGLHFDVTHFVGAKIMMRNQKMMETQVSRVCNVWVNLPHKSTRGWSRALRKRCRRASGKNLRYEIFEDVVTQLPRFIDEDDLRCQAITLSARLCSTRRIGGNPRPAGGLVSMAQWSRPKVALHRWRTLNRRLNSRTESN